MPQSVDGGSFHALLPADNPSDTALTEAYQSVYKEINEKAVAVITPKPENEANAKPNNEGKGKPNNDANRDPNGAFPTLKKAQADWKNSSLSNNKKAVDNAQAAEQKEVSGYLGLKIENIKSEIKDLENLLPTTKVFLPDVLDEKGMAITDHDLKKDPGGPKFLHMMYILY